MVCLDDILPFIHSFQYQKFSHCLSRQILNFVTNFILSSHLTITESCSWIGIILYSVSFLGLNDNWYLSHVADNIIFGIIMIIPTERWYIFVFSSSSRNREQLKRSTICPMINYWELFIQQFLRSNTTKMLHFIVLNFYYTLDIYNIRHNCISIFVVFIKIVHNIDST